MNNNLQTCFTEVKYVLKHLTKEEKNKIPFKLRIFITYNSDKNHVVYIKPLIFPLLNYSYISLTFLFKSSILSTITT